MALFNFGKKRRGTESSPPQNQEKTSFKADPAAKAEELFSQGHALYQQGDYAAAIPFFQESAQLNHPRATFYMGLVHDNGEGVGQDYAEAIRWYRIAAELGYSYAHFNIGLLYEKGLGVEKSDAEAVKWYRNAAELGLSKGQFYLGYAYDHGEGVEKNDAEAAKWYRAAADQGHAKAQTNLGLMYEKGRGVQRNYAEAARWYRAAADQGYARGQANLGYLYESGKGVEQNYAEAVRWYRLAADQGFARAQYNLATRYKSGKGVEQNYPEAAKWYRAAADQGYKNAQYNLALLYKKGQGVEQSLTEAAKWYRAAAEKGHEKAQYSLAQMYDDGNGVEQNKAEAIKWYRAAAEKGHANAQFNLGLMYSSGEGTEQNWTEAVRWFLAAAEQGDTQAQINVAALYGTGNGVKKNLAEAERWAKSAQAGGHKDAPAILEKILAERSKGQPKTLSAEEVFQRAEEHTRKNEFAEALKCYRMAAEQGHKQALERMKETRGFGSPFALAELYRDGKGVERDLVEAERWAEEAYNEVAVFAPRVVQEKAYRLLQEIRALREQEPAVDSEEAFQKGEVLYARKEYVRAAKWIRIAADQGHREARLKLAVMYERGEGVEKSKMQAKMWQRRSSSESPIGNALQEKDNKAETAVDVQYLYTDGELLYFMEPGRDRQFVLRKEDVDERKLAYLEEGETYRLYLQNGMAVDVSVWEYEQTCAKAGQAEKARQAEEPLKPLREAASKDMPQGYEAIMTRELFAGDIVLFQGEDHIVLTADPSTEGGTVHVRLRGFETGQGRGAFSQPDTFWPTKQMRNSPDIFEETWVLKEIDRDDESITVEDMVDATVHSLDYEQAEGLYTAGVGSQMCTCWFYKGKLYWAEQ